MLAFSVDCVLQFATLALYVTFSFTFITFSSSPRFIGLAVVRPHDRGEDVWTLRGLVRVSRGNFPIHAFGADPRICGKPRVCLARGKQFHAHGQASPCGALPHRGHGGPAMGMRGMPPVAGTAWVSVEGGTPPGDLART